MTSKYTNRLKIAAGLATYAGLFQFLGAAFLLFVPVKYCAYFMSFPSIEAFCMRKTLAELTGSLPATLILGIALLLGLILSVIEQKRTSRTLTVLRLLVVAFDLVFLLFDWEAGLLLLPGAALALLSVLVAPKIAENKLQVL
jgi:hypothetical protein